MSITSYIGSALIAMVGKNCFAIARDRPLGVNFQTIATERIFKIRERALVSQVLPQTCRQCLLPSVKMPGVDAASLFSDAAGSNEAVSVCGNSGTSLVSEILDEKSFGPYFCEPIIAGLNDDGQPIIYTTDFIGAKQLSKDFMVSGTASESF